jgi:hypothetical protein
VVVPSVVMWAFMIAFAFYRLRRYRAGTLEREALAHMRIAHARRTGDLRVLEARGRRAPPPPERLTSNPHPSGAVDGGGTSAVS